MEVLLDVRAFAKREGLDVGGSYEAVADMKSATPFHVVTAAYSDQLKPYTWWYPVVGAIPYRGYFDEQSAEGFAGKLRGKGLETLVVRASAYSTLGWFDDPLPSNVLERGEGAVVITVLHELVHQTFFAPGEVAFNETLATAVAWRLAERYYLEKGDSERAAKMKRARESWVARSDVLDRTAGRLKDYFAAAREQGVDRARMLEGRRLVYDEMLAELDESDPVFAKELREDGVHNASFLAAWRYAKKGRAIDAWLAQQPSVAAALERLSRARRLRMDLHEVVEKGSVPPSGPVLIEASVK